MRFGFGIGGRKGCGTGSMRWLGAVVAALAAASAAGAQNLVTNGEIDDTTDPWESAGAITLSDDWQSDSLSFSLRLVNDAPNASTVLATQCVSLAGADPVVFEAAFRTALADDATGRVRLGASWNEAPDCGPATVIVPLLFAVTVDAPGDWTLATSAPTTPPVGAVAVQVQLIAFKTSDAGTLTADFDAIYVPEPAAASAGALGALVPLILRRARRAATG